MNRNFAANRQSGADVRGRRAWVLRAGLVYCLIIAVVGLGLGRLYTSARQRLESALGDRLLAVAGALAVMADSELVFNASVGDATALPYLAILEAEFTRLVRVDALAEITLCDPDGIVLATTSGGLEPGRRNPFWELDSSAVEQAKSGRPGATRLYKVEESFLKSAHAPVMMADPGFAEGFVVGIITVSGNPDFFDALNRLRNGAVATGATVLAVLGLMGVFLHRINVSLENYRASIMRQENLAAMGRMAMGIAHEIRNPLGIIRGAGQHLQGVLARTGIQDEVADFIPEEVDRLDRILSRYLDFGTDKPGSTEVFDLGLLVRRLVRITAAEMSGSGVTILGPGETEAVPVVGDPLRLQQVVLNLLLNARDAMPEGGTAEVELEADASRVLLRVLDRGGGLPAGDPERLFEPFYTTKEKGSGLGLHLSRRIAREMGGDVVLAARADGAGAAAELILPRAPGGQQDRV